MSEYEQQMIQAMSDGFQSIIYIFIVYFLISVAFKVVFFIEEIRFNRQLLKDVNSKEFVHIRTIKSK